MEKKIKKLHFVLIHISCILAIAFIIFNILDSYNPLMNFITNSFSKTLLTIFGAVTLISNYIAFWRMRPKKRKTKDINNEQA